jgi:hypothetical protein
VIYNPITQKYNDPQKEAATQHFEKQSMVDVLAANKVSYTFIFKFVFCFLL